MSARHHSTPLSLDVPAGWFDHSVDSFQAASFAQTGLALVVRRGSCKGTLDQFMAEDLVEMRRAHADFELCGQSTRDVAGLTLHLAEVEWTHPKGRFRQHLVYGQTRERRWFRIVASALAEHAALAKKLLDQVLSTARQTDEGSAAES